LAIQKNSFDLAMKSKVSIHQDSELWRLSML